MATPADLPAISVIMRDAVRIMLDCGRCQWDESYPRDEHVFDDIMAGVGRVMTDARGRVTGYGAVVYDGEEAYDELDGEWLTDGDYVVVHRLAVAADCRGRGVASAFMKAVAVEASDRGVGAFRIDTNFDNSEMLRMLERLGFERCGTVHYPKGERIAFEKLI